METLEARPRRNLSMAFLVGGRGGVPYVDPGYGDRVGVRQRVVPCPGTGGGIGWGTVLITGTEVRSGAWGRAGVPYPGPIRGTPLPPVDGRSF